MYFGVDVNVVGSLLLLLRVLTLRVMTTVSMWLGQGPGDGGERLDSLGRRQLDV
jgi:hypothetical protein